jgi:hypothetical protein
MVRSHILVAGCAGNVVYVTQRAQSENNADAFMERCSVTEVTLFLTSVQYKERFILQKNRLHQPYLFVIYLHKPMCVLGAGVSQAV